MIKFHTDNMLFCLAHRGCNTWCLAVWLWYAKRCKALHATLTNTACNQLHREGPLEHRSKQNKSLGADQSAEWSIGALTLMQTFLYFRCLTWEELHFPCGPSLSVFFPLFGNCFKSIKHVWIYWSVLLPHHKNKSWSVLRFNVIGLLL